MARQAFTFPDGCYDDVNIDLSELMPICDIKYASLADYVQRRPEIIQPAILPVEPCRCFDVTVESGGGEVSVIDGKGSIDIGMEWLNLNDDCCEPEYKAIFNANLRIPCVPFEIRDVIRITAYRAIKSNEDKYPISKEGREYWVKEIVNYVPPTWSSAIQYVVGDRVRLSSNLIDADIKLLFNDTKCVIYPNLNVYVPCVPFAINESEINENIPSDLKDPADIYVNFELDVEECEVTPKLDLYVPCVPFEIKEAKINEKVPSNLKNPADIYLDFKLDSKNCEITPELNLHVPCVPFEIEPSNCVINRGTSKVYLLQAANGTSAKPEIDSETGNPKAPWIRRNIALIPYWSNSVNYSTGTVIRTNCDRLFKSKSQSYGKNPETKDGSKYWDTVIARSWTSRQYSTGEPVLFTHGTTNHGGGTASEFTIPKEENIAEYTASIDFSYDGCTITPRLNLDIRVPDTGGDGPPRPPGDGGGGGGGGFPPGGEPYPPQDPDEPPTYPQDMSYSYEDVWVIMGDEGTGWALSKRRILMSSPLNYATTTELVCPELSTYG